jgi:RNA polymerase sigma-70 factor (ECF subfamily)
VAPDALLPRVARGDPDAVRACIERYGALVWALARRLSPSLPDAEDAVQEIFVDLWKSAPRFDPRVAAEAVFVTLVARRRLIDRARARRRRPATEPLGDFGAELAGTFGAPNAEVCAEAKLAAEAIAALRPEPRQVLLLAIQQGMSHEEIAVTMKLPLGTVKAHARRALLHVRAWLADPKVRGKAALP